MSQELLIKMGIDNENLQRDLAKSQAIINKQSQQIEKLSAKTSTAINKVGQSSGLAGAAVMALGGGLSDMQYGLRGVANNAQQFVAMFGMLTKSAGGVKGALKSLGAAMWGPMGLVIGLQTAISLLGMWQEKQRKAKKATADLTASVDKMGGELVLLGEIINDQSQPIELRERALRKLKGTVKGLGDVELSHAGALERVNEAIKESIVLAAEKSVLDKMTEKLGPIQLAIIKTTKSLQILSKDLAKTTDSGQRGVINALIESQKMQLRSLLESKDEILDVATELRAGLMGMFDAPIAQAKELNKQWKTINRNTLIAKGIGIGNGGTVGGPTAPSSVGFVEIKTQAEAAGVSLKEMLGDFINIEEQMQSMAAGAIADMAAALGGLFGADSDIKSFGDKFLVAVADFVAMMGKLFIATGVPMLFVPGEQARGLGLIAGGAAAIAAAAAVKGSASAGSASSGGAMSTPNNSYGGGSMNPEIKVKGEDLYITLERVRQRKGRTR